MISAIAAHAGLQQITPFLLNDPRARLIMGFALGKRSMTLLAEKVMPKVNAAIKASARAAE